MKAFTDLNQSKKLSEILPLESADMHYNNVSIKGINYVDEHRAELMDYNRAIKVLSKYIINPLFEIIPCWSLAALLSVLPKQIGRYTKTLYWFDDAWHCEYVDEDSEGKHGVTADNPVDACYEMILKLNELNLL